MTNKRETITKLALILAVLGLLAGCGGGRGGSDASGTATAAGTGGGDLSGRIEADGSSTVGPYTTAAAEQFQAQEPGVQVTVGVSGTGGGFESSAAARPTSRMPRARSRTRRPTICKDGGIDYVEFQVANDALTVVVNKENTWATCLTTAQLKKIWEPGSTVKSWKDVDPAFPDEEVKLFGAGHRLGHVRLLHRVRSTARRAQAAATTAASEDDNGIVTGVGGEQGRPRLLRLRLLRGEPGQAEGARDRRRRRLRRAERATAQDGTYTPLSRPLFIYVEEGVAREARGRGLPPLLLANENAIAEKSQFVPLTDEQLTKAKPTSRGDRGVVGSDRR